jgi:hypothetical protein
MADRAKPFRDGNGQAVQLSEDFRPKEDELRRTWSRKFLELAGSAPDFPYPEEPMPAKADPETP